MTQVAYTWSRAIDNEDFTGGIYGFVPNTLDSSGERGRASFDATHNFVASYIWDIPFLKGRNDWIGKTIAGWQYSGIVTIRTGLPISPELGIDVAGVGSATRQRPFAVKSPYLSRSQRTITSWFDPAAYRPIANEDYGTFSPVARNILSGPGWNQFDMSFMKLFRFAEGRHVEVRADGFNIFNHTQWNAVGTSFSTPASFGRITSTRNERSFMVGARIQF
jgi:hypothetical protein